MMMMVRSVDYKGLMVVVAAVADAVSDDANYWLMVQLLNFYCVVVTNIIIQTEKKLVTKE